MITFANPSGALYHIRGIYVSHWQGAIDRQSIEARGVDFAYIKATEGGNYVDETFADNWAVIQRTGAKFGAYHFFEL
jgi:lysozyme